MNITRRNLFRSAGVAAGTLALGSLAADAVAGSPALRAARHGGGTTTLDSIITRGRAPKGGWRPLVRKPGEPHLVREGLGIPGQAGRATRRTPVLAFAQLSDVHMIDAQSPARAETADWTVSSSAHRPQETMSTHVAEAMVREINEIGSGPVTGLGLAFAIQTGDNSDNSQYNEIRWNIDVLDGGTVRPDSGDLTRFEGVQDDEPAYYDTSYWHPHGNPKGQAKDRYRTEAGFPVIKGLLDLVRQPFEATGLGMPWYTAFGNHDSLQQGNFPHNNALRATAIGDQKITSRGMRTVTPDPDRRLISRKEWVEEHFVTTGLPVGHGFTEDNITEDTGYYSFDQGPVRFVVMDTVNANGRDDGSLSQSQFQWLKDLLAATTDKLVVLASHHSSWTMDNAVTGPQDPGPRVLGEELVAELLTHENVVAWINGHTHRNNIRPHVREGGGGFWEINTAAHIDWPQQSRLIEITDNHDGTVSIFTTMVDHGAKLDYAGTPDTVMELAALSRLISANDPQGAEEKRRGTKLARNVELLVAAPAFLAPAP